jgi:hypothetical protein
VTDLPEGYRIEWRPDRRTLWRRVCRLIGELGWRLAEWAARREAAERAQSPVPPQPEPPAPQPPIPEPEAPHVAQPSQLPGVDARAILAAWYGAEGPPIRYLHPEELGEHWPVIEPVVQRLRPRQDAGQLVRHLVAGRLALWLVPTEDRGTWAGAVVIGAVAGTVRRVAATPDFASRWPDYLAVAITAECYRVQCRRVAPGLLSDKVRAAHDIETLAS